MAKGTCVKTHLAENYDNSQAFYSFKCTDISEKKKKSANTVMGKETMIASIPLILSFSSSTTSQLWNETEIPFQDYL